MTLNQTKHKIIKNIFFYDLDFYFSIHYLDKTLYSFIVLFLVEAEKINKARSKVSNNRNRRRKDLIISEKFFFHIRVLSILNIYLFGLSLFAF